MAVPVKPGQHSALQKTGFWLVPAIADTTAPKESEINAGGSLYITCFLDESVGGGWTTTFNKGTGLRSLCMASTPEVLNPSTVAGNDLMGFVDPQAETGADDKKAFEYLKDGFTGYLVRRLNKDNDSSDAVEGGEFVDIAPVDISPAVTDQSSADANAAYVFRAGVAVTGDVTYDVKVVDDES